MYIGMKKKGARNQIGLKKKSGMMMIGVKIRPEMSGALISSGINQKDVPRKSILEK